MMHVSLYGASRKGRVEGQAFGHLARGRWLEGKEWNGEQGVEGVVWICRRTGTCT